MEIKAEQPNNNKPEGPAIERRFFSFEARAAANDGKMTIGGTAAMFEKYTNMGWYAEVIMPGFFDNCDMEQCACLFNHDVNMVLGRKKSGTCNVKVTKAGLDYESTLPESRRDVFEVVERGDVYQSSFGFVTRKAEWEEMTREELQGVLSDADIDRLMYGGSVSVRKLIECETLYDVSPVTFPAYQDTSVAKRSFDAAEHRKIKGPNAKSAAKAKAALALHNSNK